MNDIQPLLEVRDLRIDYDVSGAASLRRRTLTVVRGVSFNIAPGETYGLVGESGSGKSTTGRAILRLADVSGGSVHFDGLDLAELPKETPLSYRRDVQAIYQDPTASLNPRHRVGRSITETLERHRIGDRSQRRRKAAEMFKKVGLTEEHLSRFPGQMSGGQLQRVAIARALVLEPRLVVCDEAVSALISPLRARSSIYSRTFRPRAASATCSLPTILAWCAISRTMLGCCGAVSWSSRGRRARFSRRRRTSTPRLCWLRAPRRILRVAGSAERLVPGGA